jgi:hypothetical protein
MTTLQLIYSSQPFGFDEAILSGVLLDARRCNKRDGITGALICRHELYLQLLEGPETVVRSTYDRIQRDDRHVNIVERVAAPVSDRLFGDWAMLHDPARSLLWSADEINDGILDRVSPDDIRNVFVRLSETLRSAPPA